MIKVNWFEYLLDFTLKKLSEDTVGLFIWLIELRQIIQNILSCWEIKIEAKLNAGSEQYRQEDHLIWIFRRFYTNTVWSPFACKNNFKHSSDLIMSQRAATL